MQQVVHPKNDRGSLWEQAALIVAAILCPIYILHTHWTLLDLAIIPWGIYYLIRPATENIRYVYFTGVIFTTVFTLLDIMNGLPFRSIAIYQHTHVVCFSSAYVGLNLLLKYGSRRFLLFMVVLLVSVSINAFFRGERLIEEDTVNSLPAWQYALKCRWGHCLLILPALMWIQRRWLLPFLFPLIGLFMIFIGDARMLGCSYIAASALYFLSRQFLCRLSYKVLLFLLVPALLLGGFTANYLLINSKLFESSRISRYVQSNRERMDMANLAIKRILVKPFSGFGSASDKVPVFRPFIGYIDSQVHGFPLGLMLQYGVPGLVYAILLICVGISGLCALVICSFKNLDLHLDEGFPFYTVLLLAFIARGITSVYKTEVVGIYGLTIGLCVYSLMHLYKLRSSAIAGKPVFRIYPNQFSNPVFPPANTQSFQYRLTHEPRHMRHARQNNAKRSQ